MTQYRRRGMVDASDHLGNQKKEKTIEPDDYYYYILREQRSSTPLPPFAIDETAEDGGGEGVG
uniref:Uncharacterized protein n=1 Tax=Oryza sativa subsp. japonica TaxID=39947 RepID=Q6K3Z4_ORYSJ|nr:hypothetical protein [Oryza sativa Japonica Group]